jgi:HTH-type transcriptional regulator, sugar sensing transcriptional regulator
MYEKELQSLGLSEKEARVYISSLELGPETAQNISKKAAINRATTYVQIEALKKKGLMSEFEKDKKTFFLAEPPERLQSLLLSLQKELEFKKGEIARILPDLETLGAGVNERPKVRFYEGPEGFRAVNAAFLKMKRRVTENFINMDKISEISPGHEQEYSPLRIQRRIESYIIYTSSKGPIEGMTDPKKFRTAKFIENNVLPIAADISIFDDKAILVPYKKKPVEIMIESKEITDTLRGMFYFTWKTLS